MRLLVVSQYFWPESFRINDVVQSLTSRGHHVEVLTGKPNYPEGAVFPSYRAGGCQVEIWADTTVHRLPILARGTNSKVGLSLNYLSFILSGVLLAPWMLRGRKFDAIFVYAPSPILQAIPALYLGWLKGRKVVIWVQDLWPQSLSATGYVRNSIVLKLVEWLVRFIYRKADLLLVQSKAFLAPVSALAPGRVVEYYPNSVDASFGLGSRSDVISPDVPELESGFSVVFTGNVGIAQGVDVMLEAAKLLLAYPEIRLIVFGQGSRWDWMREQIALLGLTNVHLPGRYPVSAMPAVLQKASALLVTLKDTPIFAQTIPNKIQAYMAAGRPIVASLNGEGSRIVAEAGAGLCVPAGDAQALAEAVLQLYKLPQEQLAAMGKRARSYYNVHFDHELLLDQLVERLGRLCARSVRSEHGEPKDSSKEGRDR